MEKKANLITRRPSKPPSLCERHLWYLPLSLLVGFAVLCPILAGIAGMMLFTDAPNWMISCMAAVALLFSGYTMGYFVGYHRRRHGFKTGLFCGIAFFSVLLVVGLV